MYQQYNNQWSFKIRIILTYFLTEKKESRIVWRISFPYKLRYSFGGQTNFLGTNKNRPKIQSKLFSRDSITPLKLFENPEIPAFKNWKLVRRFLSLFSKSDSFLRALSKAMDLRLSAASIVSRSWRSWITVFSKDKFKARRDGISPQRQW